MFIAQQAATVVGLAARPVQVIRLGSNAVLRLPGGVVARVARDESWLEVAVREVDIATALRRAGVGCVQPWPVRQPVVIERHPVTFWKEIPGPLEQPTMTDLGRVLRQLHQASPQVPLPALDPWDHTPQRIEQAPISTADRRVLRDAQARVEDEWTSVEFMLDPGVIHGDAYLGNLARGADGSVVLLDFDSVCRGPREWDLVPTGLYASSLGWLTRGEYDAFVSAYGGFDVTRSPAFDVLARIREIRMTAWLAMYASESEQVAAQVTHRVACIADPALPRHWTAR